MDDTLITTLLLKCKTDQNELLWLSNLNQNMVGYYNETTPLAMAPVQTSEEVGMTAIKRVVCSPDLPISNFQNNPTPQLDPQLIECNRFQTKPPFPTVSQKMLKLESDDPYRCNICAKTFAVPARLTRHYRTHTGEKPFRCEFCDKSFSVKENLSVHRRIHTKERPYKCDVCSRAFEHSGKLHRHMRIHTGERPHKCSVCSKTFIQSGQLVIHMRTHTGEKPYVCGVCQKGFTCSKQLKVHSRTHTGEKPYSCEICGKSFGYNHVLKLHQVAHYGEKVYKCTICNDTFNSKKCMEAHIKSHSENAGPISPPSSIPSSESSCSSTSDKENKDSPSHQMFSQEAVSYDSDIRYYLYGRDRIPPPYFPNNSSSGVDLLAAAATVTERVHEEYLRRSPPEVIRPYFPPPIQFDPQLNHADDIRKRVEAALAVAEIEEESILVLTPPNSNPVSPAPSVSPSISPDPELSLPPRKRSRMILKSMESEKETPPIRYSSVIHYANKKN